MRGLRAGLIEQEAGISALCNQPFQAEQPVALAEPTAASSVVSLPRRSPRVIEPRSLMAITESPLPPS